MSTKLNVKLITDNLADELIARMQHASGIYIMTSFIMQSGGRLLAPHLKRAAERGAEVRMLAGDYLYISQPEGCGHCVRSIHELKLGCGEVGALLFTRKRICSIMTTGKDC